MARKGMKSLLFSPKASSTSSLSSSSSSDHEFSSPSRFGFSPSRPSFYESVMDRTLDMAEPIITKWDPKTTAFGRSVTSLFQENRREAKDFIKLVTNLQRAMQFLITENSSSQKLVRAQNLMQVAMNRLQKEFYHILSSNGAHLDSESISARTFSFPIFSESCNFSANYDEDNDGRAGNGSEIEVDVPTHVMAALRLIAECMIYSGYGKECLKIYKIIRQSVVDEGIYRLGVQKFSPSQIHKMDWESVDSRIEKWLAAVRSAVRAIFNGERILCDTVFAASDSIRDSCFAEITNRGATTLFEFPEQIVKNSRQPPAPEMTFRSLDMYAAISDQWKDIASILSSVPNVINRALTSLSRLGEHVRSSVDGFESAISKDASKPSFGGGSEVQKLTIDVMDYLSVLSEYIDIFADSPPPVKRSSPKIPAISLKMERLILVLLCKLDGKARHLRDASQAYTFLADNLRYVVVQVRMSNLKYLLGDEWLTRHEDKVKHYESNYVFLDGK